jgi:hypothetical protein
MEQAIHLRRVGRALLRMRRSDDVLRFKGLEGWAGS